MWVEMVAWETCENKGVLYCEWLPIGVEGERKCSDSSRQLCNRKKRQLKDARNKGSSGRKSVWIHARMSYNWARAHTHT